MSAPLVVNTRDGACWTRRTVTEGGIALYALADVCKCPEFVMVTLAELAERGIVGSADVLPVPVSPARRTLDQVEDELTGANLSLYEEELLTERLRWALASAKRGRARLRARVAALLEERHSTNESVSEAAEALRVQRDRIAELEAGIAWRDAERDRWAGVRYLVEKAIDKGWSTLDTLDVEAELGPEPAPVPAESVAEPSCPCPPADQPGPHQLGCPLAEVPDRSVEESAARLSRFLAPAALREVLDGEHFATVHHDYRVGHDLPVPESCRLDAAGLDEVGQRFLGGGA